MQIGRKIYYELSTGNVILDTGERYGDVIETTVEQDFQMYADLQKYQQSAVGILQLDFGDYAENIGKYPYHIDITNNPVEILWDINNPIGASLDDIKKLKIKQLTDFYNQTLGAGFTSSATGITYTFGYGQTDREKFMQLAILVLAGKAIFPVNIPAIDYTQVSHTQEQYNQLVDDISTFGWIQQNKLQQLVGLVNAASSQEEIDLINW